MTGPFMGTPSQHVISHPYQHSLLPSTGRKMRTRKNVANLCGRGLKAGTAHSTCGLNTWVAGKTIVVPCYQASYLSALVMTKLSH